MSDQDLEPAWIRDIQASPIDFKMPDPENVEKMLEEICEGEKLFCEYCGAEKPLWPMKHWADHQISEHGANMTIQVRSGNALLCQGEMNYAIQALFNAQFTARVSMRRRAWQLGYAVVQELEGRVKLSN